MVKKPKIQSDHDIFDSRRYVNSSDMFPENNTGSNKVVISGQPYYWEQYRWLRDTQAREGEYDNAPICEDPKNVSFSVG